MPLVSPRALLMVLAVAAPATLPAAVSAPAMLPVTLPAAALPPGDPVPAVWRERHVDFIYRGRTARYSCDGLRDKVRALLLDLGARRDLKIAAIGCGGPVFAHSMQPSLSIIFSAPAPALPDARPLHVGDLAATEARFEAFTLTSDAFRNLGIGDCELVEEFARQILPKLTTRHVHRDIACVPYRQNGNFWIRGETLKSLPLAGQPPASEPLKSP